MSSVAAGVNRERTNRWLLIGAAVLAIAAGVLVFALLANSGSTDSGKSSAGPADATVLVARQSIDANTKLTAAMFEVKSVPSASLVVNHVSDAATITGTVTRSAILKGEQLSSDRLGLNDGEKTVAGLAPTIPDGYRGKSVAVSGANIVSGLIVPGDRVDVIVTYHESGTGNDVVRVETLLQNVQVLAIAQSLQDNLPTLDASGTPVAQDPNAQLGARPEDEAPNAGAGTATLALTPEQVELVTAADAKGDLSLVLRGLGDDKLTDQPPLRQDNSGLLPRP